MSLATNAGAYPRPFAPAPATKTKRSVGVRLMMAVTSVGALNVPSGFRHRSTAILGSTRRIFAG